MISTPLQAVAWRKLAQHAGDLLLAAPQHQVLRVLSLPPDRCLPVYASVDEAARIAGVTGERLRQWTGVPPASP